MGRRVGGKGADMPLSYVASSHRLNERLQDTVESTKLLHAQDFGLLTIRYVLHTNMHAFLHIACFVLGCHSDCKSVTNHMLALTDMSVENQIWIAF